MSETKELLRRGVDGFEPTPDAFERLLARRDRKQRNQRVAAGVFGIAVFALAAIGFGRLLGSGSTPAVDPDSPFLGTWISTSDADGGTQTMTVRVSADGVVQIVVTDDIATVCSGTPSTMTGTGRIEGTTRLVIPAPEYTCDDGSEPQAVSGPPLQEQLRNLTFVLDAGTETLTDTFGGVWLREGAEDGVEPLEGLDAPWDPSRFGGTWESTPADTGFLGTWESTDIDGSSLLLGIRVSEDASDTFEILLLDGAETCPSFYGPIPPDGPITMIGVGRVEGREMAIDSQTWFCEAAGGPDVVTGDASLQIAAAHTPLVHDPETDTLVGPTGRPPGAPSWMQGRGVVWHRRPPGSDPIGVPFWGVWPQSSLEEAEEAQRRADAGDPAFTWQLAPELAAPPEGETFQFPYVFPEEPAAANGAEILARFSRDVLGWERYVTVARRDPWNSGEAGWTFVWIRCGPGTNPLYPDDPNGGDCPPTIGDTHYQTVSLMVTQPVGSGPTGIWVVAGWTELAPSEEPASDLRYHEWVSRQYEQVAPPTEAELVEALAAFLSARVAGEGAEAYLTEDYYWWRPRPRVPLLYATTEGHRYERFEIGSVEGPRWPAGVYTVTVRLFARGGEDVVEQEFAVWPGSRGQLTMDIPWRGGTTENGVDLTP